MSGKPVLVAATINVNSCYCGRYLTEIQLPEHCIFLGVIRKGKFVLASDEAIALWCEDYLVAVALKPMLAPALQVILNKTHPVSWFPGKSCTNQKTESLYLSIDALSSLARATALNCFQSKNQPFTSN